MKRRVFSMIALILAVMMTVTVYGAQQSTSKKAKLTGYTFHVVDPAGKAVKGVSVQVCSESSCTRVVTDDKGTAVFNGKPDAYEVHIIKYPSEYYYDKGKVYVTAKQYEEVTFTLKKADSTAKKNTNTKNSENSKQK